MVVRRFLYGFLSQSTEAYGIAMPWKTSDEDGNFEMRYSFEESVKDNLIFWAKTNWGEIPYKFRFGLDARRYLFDPVEVAKERILQNARQQLRDYFPFLSINSLEVLTFDDRPDISENSILFVLSGVVNEQELQIEVPLEP